MAISSILNYLNNLLSFSGVNTAYCKPCSNVGYKVFVYGTLKSNEPNHHWLTNPENGSAKFIAKGTTKTKYPLIIATKYNLPFLLYSPGRGNNVEGEIYEVDNAMLDKLDVLEDHPKFYVREQDEILVKDTSSSALETQKCWVYFLKTFKPELLCRTFMINYSSRGSHGLPYTEKSKLDPSYSHWPDIRD